MGISSPTQICNNAVTRLGSNPFPSLTDATNPVAAACNNLYDPARRALLRQFNWNFAIKRLSIASSGTAPAFEYKAQYPLPADYIRMVMIYLQNSDYKIEGSMILTNDASPLNIKYVADITDTTQFNDLFTEALTIMLAIKLGNRLNGNGFSPGTLVEEFKEIISDAKLVDSQDQTPTNLILSTYEDNMWTGVGNWINPNQQGM